MVEERSAENPYAYAARMFLLSFSIVFLLFLIVQLVRNLAGGSWGREDITMGVSIATFTSTVFLAFEIGNAKADFHKSLARVETTLSREIYRLREDLKSDIHKLDNRMERIESKSRH